MLKLTLFEMIIRTIPEGFLFILASYIFSGQIVEKKRYCLAGVLIGISTYLIRMLPINFGVHTIILLVIYVLIGTLICRINVVKCISAGLVSVIIMFTSELVNVYLVQNVFKVPLEKAVENPYMKQLYFMPSLLIFAAVIFILYKILYKPVKVTNYVSN
jgi:hypothetical protein